MQESLLSVTYESTGNELIGKLKYFNELLLNKPKFNFHYPKKASKVAFSNPNMLLIDKGRSSGEKSVIVIENNKLLGYCYVDLEYQINHIEILKSLISPLKNNLLNRSITKKYLQEHIIEKIIRF